MSDDVPVTPDPWAALRTHTAARVALGRAGASLPTAELLRFSLDHAMARDAVHSELDLDQLTKDLEPIGLPTVHVDTQVHDRTTYLQRPDLGRRLSDGGRERLKRVGQSTPCDLAIVVADGLSAWAAQQHAAALLAMLVPQLHGDRVTLGPLVTARYARVALQDDIGATMNAKASLILLGERPGLGAPDGLSAYLIFNPRLDATDADRNCISNIRPTGLPLSTAAETICYLVGQMLQRGMSGVGLKDERNGLIGYEMQRFMPSDGR